MCDDIVRHSYVLLKVVLCKSDQYAIMQVECIVCRNNDPREQSFISTKHMTRCDVQDRILINSIYLKHSYDCLSHRLWTRLSVNWIIKKCSSFQVRDSVLFGARRGLISGRHNGVSVGRLRLLWRSLNILDHRVDDAYPVTFPSPLSGLHYQVAARVNQPPHPPPSLPPPHPLPAHSAFW